MGDRHTRRGGGRSMGLVPRGPRVGATAPGRRREPGCDVLQNRRLVVNYQQGRHGSALVKYGIVPPPRGRSRLARAGSWQAEDEAGTALWQIISGEAAAVV